jgi:integrase
MKLFKKTTVRYLDPNGKRCGKEAPGAARVVEKSRKWYGTVNGEQVPLCSDKANAKQTLARLLDKSTMSKLGLSDPFAEHKATLLVDHLSDYASHLRSKGNTPEHVNQSISRVAALFNGCGFKRLEDTDAGRAAEWLDQLRRPKPIQVSLLPGIEHYAPAEVAAMFGISGAAVRSAIKRHGLDVIGQGKTRRLPRTTVAALVDRSNRGCGPETVNHYVRATRGFFRWMVRAKRVAGNPLDAISLVSVNGDIRRGRRELSADELRRLLTSVRESSRTYRGLTGTDRFHLYLTAATTGFRARALSNLTPSDFDLVGDTPTVSLAARFAKNRKSKVQPLPTETATQLGEYVQSKPLAVPVWGGTWARDHRGAEMLRADLADVGIAYVTDGPEGPEYSDFHSLRHSYLTLGGLAGIDLRTLQELAGHSKPELTARYSRRRPYDLAGAVEKMPNLLPKAEQVIRQQATGTDGPGFGCTLVARNEFNSGLSLSSAVTVLGGGSQSQETTKPQLSPGFEHVQTLGVIASPKRGRRDSNPQPPDRQSPHFGFQIHNWPSDSAVQNVRA